MPFTQGRASLSSTRVRVGLVGALAAVTGVVLYGVSRPGLPAEFTNRPAVHDCGEEFVTSSGYQSAKPALRKCLFEAYHAGRPAEFREKGQYGYDAAYVVTGPGRVDIWIDYTPENGSLYRMVGCALGAARPTEPNYVFEASVDPATDRLLCTTQFIYLRGDRRSSRGAARVHAVVRPRGPRRPLPLAARMAILVTVVVPPGVAAEPG